MKFRKSRAHSRRNSTNFMIDSEKWRPYGKRLSRRDNDDIFDEDSDDDPNHIEVQDWAEEFFGRKSVCGDTSDQDVEVQLSKKQTLILSTLLPDEILLMEKFDCAEPSRFVGVLMMADVSGYTALSERYNAAGKGGIYRLTVTLNTYLGALIELIYSHGGDILKFAGDAFLALWKTDKKSYLYQTIHTVIACALLIQHSYARYETDVKVNLRVKLAISAGNLMFSPIGAGIDMNYVIFGLPVIEAKLAESLCASGEVKLTPTAWAHCFSRNYDHILHDDGHVTIKSILYDPHERDITKPFLGFATMVNQIKKNYSAIESLPNCLWDATNNLNAADNLKKNEALSLRTIILVAEERNIGSQIRKFMLRPVLTQIDAHQPLEYLTEMRQVSVLFLTLKPRECSPAQLITIVNNSYQITCEIVYKSMGCVNKIILFDKDIMTLVIFGLRGFKHESEAQAALKCAYSIKKSISALDGVLEVSIGVTTGPVYCGVIGHPLRREFTVIGAIVNKAARLMCMFRNRISCDDATFVSSKMSKNGFTLQPRTELKGIGYAGKIYLYTEEIRPTELFNIPMIPPLLNRRDEMEYFENWIEDTHLSFRDFDALLLIGESRIGKSRLLEWMARHARNKGHRVCYISLTSIHSANSYLALSQIVNQILDLEEPIRGFDKEEKIIDILKAYNEDLCYLNNVVKVRFAFNEGIYGLDDNTRNEKAKAIFAKFIGSISETHVIFLDDLQNLDASSWEFISLMFSAMKFFTVVTVTRGKFSTVHKWLYSVFINNSIRKIVLGPLTSGWIAPLACQILDVDAIPNDLCNALRTKCKGMPGLVESFIMHLFSTGAIELVKIVDNQLEEWKTEDLQFPNSSQLRAQALYTKDQANLEQLMENDATGEIKICTVTQKSELNTNINVQNVDALIMIQIDALTPYQQLLLKIASVIGDVLSRDLLENIMYENNPLITAKAIKRLFAMRIFACANTSIINRYQRKLTLSSATPLLSNPSTAAVANLSCECRFEYESGANDNLPKYAFCKVMKFRNKNSRKTCYELLPVNQKKEFHSRIVNYLENNKQKCTVCGGATMIVESLTNLKQPSFVDFNSAINIRGDTISSSSGSTDTQEKYNVSKKSSHDNQEKSEDFKCPKSESFDNFDYYTDLLRTASEKLCCIEASKGIPTKSSSMKSAPILKKKSAEEESESRRSKRVTMSSFMFKNNMRAEDFSDIQLYEMLRPVTEADKIVDWHVLGVIDSTDDIKREQNEVNSKNVLFVRLQKDVSQTDFTKCTCAELNIIIYEQLIHHAKQAEMIKKAIEFSIHYSYLNIMADNIDVALEKLLEAETDCSNKYIETILTKLERRRFLARIYTLKAVIYSTSGKLLAAKLEIERASRMYGYNLHNLSAIYNLKELSKSIKFKSKEYRAHENIMKAESVFCLNAATVLYCTVGDERVARGAAFRALQLVQTVECTTVNIFETLTNAIQIEIDRGTPESTAEIEKIIRKVLRNLPRSVQAEELYTVGKLFMATFRARLARGNLPASIRAGIKAIVVSHFLHANNVSLAIIPDLFYVLLCRRRIQEAIEILRLTLYLGKNEESYVSETWYYALCMDLVLDAGFQLESPYEINRYSDYVLHKNNSDSAGRRRLVVNMWTYWLRVDPERRAKRFEDEALSWATREDDNGTLTSLLSALRLAEGMLESLARKVDDLRKVVDMMELRSIADRELNKLESDCRRMRSVYPRWILLKGNTLALSARSNVAISTFNHAFEEARRMDNCLAQALARAALSNSRVWVQNAQIGNFVDWRIGGETAAMGSWHQLCYKITTTR